MQQPKWGQDAIESFAGGADLSQVVGSLNEGFNVSEDEVRKFLIKNKWIDIRPSNGKDVLAAAEAYVEGQISATKLIKIIRARDRSQDVTSA